MRCSSRLAFGSRTYDWQHGSGEPLRIVTFNYDTILEDALQTVFGGWDLQRDLPRFIERDDCRLYKLHGSVAWSRAVRAQSERYSMMVSNADTSGEAARQLLTAGRRVTQAPCSALWR